MKVCALLFILGCGGTHPFTANLKYLGHVSPPLPLRVAASDGSAAQINEHDIQSGRVLFYDPTKGFGFIVPDNSSGRKEENVFAHQSKINMDGFRYLKPNQRVTYRPALREDGKLFAVDISAVESDKDDTVVDWTMLVEEEVSADIMDVIAQKLKEEKAIQDEASNKPDVTTATATTNLDPFAALKSIFKI